MDLTTCLSSLNASWPVPSASLASLSSTFGPRIKLSRNGYDFHRGLDISSPTGTPVTASLSGTFLRYDTTSFTDGGNTIILQHSIPPTIFHDRLVSSASTLYMHLSSSSSATKQGDCVEKGDVIGYVGHSGKGARDPHLHFELRVGCLTSLERQLNLKQSTFLYDPHVHPLVLFPSAAPAATLTVARCLTQTEDAVVIVTTPGHFPAVVSYTLYVSGVPNFVLDVVHRTGFDASSTQAIDTQNKTVPYIQPLRFDKRSSLWRVEYRVPVNCVPHVHPQPHVVLSVADVFGRSVQADLTR